MCSLSASPDPNPSQKRPGYIAIMVAAAWAMIAGWERNDGQVTPGPMSPRVCSAAAVMNDQTNDACPCCGTQGWTWSAAITPENPEASAFSQNETSSRGWNCSSMAA